MEGASIRLLSLFAVVSRARCLMGSTEGALVSQVGMGLPFYLILRSVGTRGYKCRAPSHIKGGIDSFYTSILSAYLE